MKKKTKKPHYQVTAGLLWHEGKLLITSRPKGRHLAGFWEFPGGKQEEGETLKKCLEREIREELGIEVLAGKHLMTVDHEYENRIISLHLFQCTPLEGQIRPLEGQKIRWVDPKDLEDYRFPPPDYEFIGFLKRGEESYV